MGIIMHHSDAVGLNLRLCDPWMAGASNKTNSHRIRLWKKSSACHSSWCQGTSVDFSVNLCLREWCERSVVQSMPQAWGEDTYSATAIASHSEQQRHEHAVLVICELGHLLQCGFGCLASTGRRNWQHYWVSVGAMVLWARSPSKKHSQTNGHLGIQVSTWRTKKYQLMSQGSPDPWLFFCRAPLWVWQEGWGMAD